MSARIVLVKDPEERDGYGPYLFAITDPELEGPHAAARLTELLVQVKEDEGYMFGDFLNAIKAAGLGVALIEDEDIFETTEAF